MGDQRVLIFPPSRRDGEVTRDLLGRAGITSDVCFSAPALAEEMEVGVGALVLTDAALVMSDLRPVLEFLTRQQPWSDLPIVLLCQTADQSPIAGRVISGLTNVTLLDRPTSARTLLSAVQAALRARVRQYQTREQLEALRQAEEALLARERQLHLADRRKDEFLAMLAHELRNPLAPIRNVGELLSRLLPNDHKVQTTAAIVKRQIAHLSRLVDDLLDVSRITQGRIELQRKPVDLCSVVAHALESVEPLMHEKHHNVTATTPSKPIYVSGDGARLVQCVANILTNAAKYTDEGGTIGVELRQQDRLAIVTVTDDGVGIPQELLPQIFELFVQSDRSLDRSQGGLGIGLSVVQRLIEMHGGTVAARSDGPGQGSTFEVRLPCIPTPRPMREDEQFQTTSTKRVLIVDDNADAADSLALLLKLEGFDVEPVYGSSEALERTTEFDPQVILLDIGLPGMDGYEVARRVRASGSGAQIVALTGYGQSDDVRRARAAGFDGHLVKPVDLQTLLRTLHR